MAWKHCLCLVRECFHTTPSQNTTTIVTQIKQIQRQRDLKAITKQEQIAQLVQEQADNQVNTLYAVYLGQINQ